LFQWKRQGYLPVFSMQIKSPYSKNFVQVTMTAVKLV
jgi:hypothetical protein